MSAKQIRAGAAFVELFATDTKLTRALDAAVGKVKRFAGTVASIGLKAGAAGGAILAPLGKSLFDALGTGAEIKRISQQYGETTNTISELSSAFQVAGVNMAEFSGGLDGLKGRIKAAADAGALFDESVASIGRARDLEKMPLTKQMETLLDALARMPDATQRTIKAQEWFGAAMATKMLPYLDKGAAGLKQLRAEAQKRGWVMSADDIERSSDAMKAWNTIMDETANTIVALGSALLPTTDQTKDITTRIKEAFAAAREWVAENKGLLATVVGIGAGLVGVGLALPIVAAGIKIAGTALSGITIAVKGILGGIGLLKSPLGLLGLSIGGMAALWFTFTDAGKQAFADLKASLNNIAATFKEAWGGIVAAVGKGDLATAFKIAGVGIKAIWLELILALGEAFRAFIEDNRKKLMALAALSGGLRGGKLGSRLGPWGTVAGVVAGAGGAAVATDAVLDELKDLGHNPKIEAELAKTKKELRELVAGAKAPGGPGGADLDAEIKRGAEETRKRFESYAANIKQGQEAALNIGNRQKGIFSGPAQQQLGYGDTVAKRQLDVQKEIAKGIADGNKDQKAVREQMEKVLSLVTWN